MCEYCFNQISSYLTCTEILVEDAVIKFCGMHKINLHDHYQKYCYAYANAL